MQAGNRVESDSPSSSSSLGPMMNEHESKEKLSAGSQAPDVSLADHAGQAVRLSQFWASQPLLLLFVRHFG